MMANICLQTYLVSNLSALLTRADVGIYTMRSLVLLSTNEARSFNGHVSGHFGVNCGKFLLPSVISEWKAYQLC